ncbi:ribokinase [Gluconobacter thailandicus F149-1 = NBRC 100600]|uniref:Ribokinase n=1 Tax=Gluconobacter thailandicus NBRC 3257 TaxID=1381097 RepID=A0ABQ0IZ76_GLUTH|nr:ribokinase [Gluconobacter thailandicus]KXV53000.1 ribokinase [Gluconobacter thailandicus]GAC86967.1 ribokinase [Gluconobacter thailandicus NBRC 3255]GAD27516.1 ribokinase [Gluconobacter thailandicus NBRC 3257]GAN93611.1 ribokinase [Gluconobacter thailandicus F149-1 = NBRC 100600]GBR61166.1 ribokinase [Gluconobacter thailandicus F149-1 = NBRC 100600]
MPDNTPLILSFGSINIDVTARAARLPRPGETVHGESYAVMLGGKGSNQAAAAGRLAAGSNVQVALAGRIGKDGFGVQAHQELERFGVDLSPLLKDAANPTGIALIGIDGSGENCITVVGGANMAVDETDVLHAEQWLSRAKVLLLQLEIPQPAVLAAARRARNAGAIVVLDPAPAPENGLLQALWQEIDVLTPNESETFQLTGIRAETVEDAARAAEVLLAKGAKAALVKMGSRGVFWHDGTRSGYSAPFQVQPVDTVAAGDCFNAGLAYALAQGQTLEKAVRIASACGALATTRHGAADAAPEWNAVTALMSAQPEN